MNKEQIRDVVETTEDFIAEVICPKLEEYGGAGDELISNIRATCMTAAMAVEQGITKYRKIGSEWRNNNPPRKKPEKPVKEPDIEKRAESAAKALEPLITKIVDICDEYGEDEKEKNANYASTVLTMIHAAPKQAKEMMMVGIIGLMTGEIDVD